MPSRPKITKRFPIPEELNLLKEKMKRPCDSEYWGIHGRLFGKESCMEFIKQDLIEREKQLFQYYGIPYVEIDNNSIHYLIYQLAGAAGFHGFEFAKEPGQNCIGHLSGDYGRKFCLRVMLDMLSNNTSRAKSINVVLGKYYNDNRKLCKHNDIAIKFCQKLNSDKTLSEFNSRIHKNMSDKDKSELISDIEQFLNFCCGQIEC